MVFPSLFPEELSFLHNLVQNMTWLFMFQLRFLIVWSLSGLSTIRYQDQTSFIMTRWEEDQKGARYTVLKVQFTFAVFDEILY